MTKEQEEAIERLNSFRTIKILYGNTFAMHLGQLETVQTDIETVLNMLKEKDKEIEKYKRLYNKALDDLVIAEHNNIRKDKIIDLMAGYIATLDIEEDICIKTGRLNKCDKMSLGECEDCIKQYFAGLVEKE